MSLDATVWAWKQELKPTLKILLLSLADRANENHGCWPSVPRLEKDTGLNRKTILTNLRLLESIGLIEIVTRGGRQGGNIYRLIGVACRHECSTENGTSPKNGTSTKNGPLVVPKTVPLVVPKTVPKSTINLSENLPIYVDAKLFDEFLQVRKKLKAVNSERAIKLLLTEFEKIHNLGQDVNEAIKRSIVNSWKSVYPEKVKHETHQRTGQYESNHARVGRRLQERLEARFDDG